MYTNKRKGIFKHLDFMILDIVCLILSFVFATLIRYESYSSYNHEYHYTTLFVMVLLEIVLTFFYEPFKNVLKRGNLKELKSTLIFVVLNMLGTTFYLFVSKSGSLNSRLVVAYTYIIYFVLSLLTRIALKEYIIKKSYASLKNGNKSLFVITSKRKLKDNIERIANNNFDMHHISGICVLDEDMKGQSYEGYPIVANKDDALDWACSQWIDSVFFGVGTNKAPKELIEGLAAAGITIHKAIDDDFLIEGQSRSVNKIGSYTVLTSSNREYSNFELFVKRLMDICGGIVGCIITLILTIIIGPIIYIKSPGPIFYTSERIGLNGKRFQMYKFRSMIMNAEKMRDQLQKQNIMKDGMMFKIADDPRIIPGIGTFIRKTSLDEFPQFFNVLKGEMSLVGTRPPIPDEWEKYKPEHRIRMSIKPGVTGLWQISGRNTILDFDEVVRLDKEYIDNFSLSLDIKILFKTIVYLLNRKDDAM